MKQPKSSMHICVLMRHLMLPSICFSGKNRCYVFLCFSNVTCLIFPKYVQCFPNLPFCDVIQYVIVIYHQIMLFIYSYITNVMVPEMFYPNSSFTFPYEMCTYLQRGIDMFPFQVFLRTVIGIILHIYGLVQRSYSKNYSYMLGTHVTEIG